MCRGLFFYVQWFGGENWEVIVYYVDINEVIDYHF